MKVGTQNLRILTAKESINPFSERFWIKRMKRIAENIKSVDLDLIAVQESIGRLQMYVLRYYLGWRKYRFISVRQGLTPSRVGIMYKTEFNISFKHKFRLSEAESLKKHARWGIWASFYTGWTTKIDFASVHLSHYSAEAFNDGMTGLKYLSINIHGLIIAGDFNRENITLKNRYKADTFVQKTYISFNDDYQGQKIDYIFTPVFIERGQTQTLGDNLASDHLLVYSEITI